MNDRKFFFRLALIALLLAAATWLNGVFVLPKHRTLESFRRNRASFEIIAGFITDFDKSGYPVSKQHYPKISIQPKEGLRSESPCRVLLRYEGGGAEITPQVPALDRALHRVLHRSGYTYIAEPGFVNQCIFFYAPNHTLNEECGLVYTKDGQPGREAVDITVVYTERLDQHWYYWEGDWNE